MEHPESYYNAYSLLKNYGSQNESISEVCQKIVEILNENPLEQWDMSQLYASFSGIYQAYCEDYPADSLYHKEVGILLEKIGNHIPSDVLGG